MEWMQQIAERFIYCGYLSIAGCLILYRMCYTVYKEEL